MDSRVVNHSIFVSKVRKFLQNDSDKTGTCKLILLMINIIINSVHI
jgi:hypothetical protein